MQTDTINIALSYKYTLYMEVAHTNYFTSSLNTFANKIPIPNFGVLFAYLFTNKKLYYSGGLFLNKSINPTSISL